MDQLVLSSVTPEHAVNVLNEALAADPDAINAMFAHRVSCNEALADHETIQARGYVVMGALPPPNIGALGLINGIFGVTSKESATGFIQIRVSDKTGKIVSFALNAFECVDGSVA